MKLIGIIKSPNPEKKYRALFQTEDGLMKHTDFGMSGASDYTMHQDKERRDRYRERHKKDLETNDPTRAGYLSYYILWNKPTLEASIRDYKKRFKM